MCESNPVEKIYVQKFALFDFRFTNGFILSVQSEEEAAKEICAKSCRACGVGNETETASHMRKQKTSRQPLIWLLFFCDRSISRTNHISSPNVGSCHARVHNISPLRIAFKSLRPDPLALDGEVAVMSTGWVYQNILMEAIIARRLVYFQLALSIEEIIKSLL